MENKASEQQPEVILTKELVEKNFEILTKAAAVGGKSSLSGLVTKARDTFVYQQTAEGIANANEQVGIQWFGVQKFKMSEGKANTEKTDHVGIMKGLLSLDFLGVAMAVMKDKIAIFTEATYAYVTREDKNRSHGSFMDEKTQIHNIMTYAENNGLDGAMLLAELKNPSKENIQLASLSKPEQIAKMNADKLAEEQRVATEEQNAIQKAAAAQLKVEQEKERQAAELLKRKKDLEASQANGQGDSAKGPKIEGNGDVAATTGQAADSQKGGDSQPTPKVEEKKATKDGAPTEKPVVKKEEKKKGKGKPAGDNPVANKGDKKKGDDKGPVASEDGSKADGDNLNGQKRSAIMDTKGSLQLVASNMQTVGSEFKSAPHPTARGGASNIELS